MSAAKKYSFSPKDVTSTVCTALNVLQVYFHFSYSIELPPDDQDTRMGKLLWPLRCSPDVKTAQSLKVEFTH